MGHQRKVSVIGLGYVGLTIASTFGQKEKVIGFDINPTRIAELKKSYDRNHEVSTKYLSNADIHYTTDPHDLKFADFHIISVLTPIDNNKRPDLTILLKATKTIAHELKFGDIVVYESTVYPGATEEKCIPLLESVSGLRCGIDFFVGYSPERINPSDRTHTFENIKKIISATDLNTLEIVGEVYASVIPAGVHPVSCIRVAEATKIIENTQRDLNISLINEIALILHHLGMETTEIIEAAKTKWNYVPFQPGLVGGHCIGVNSYYLTFKSEEAGYHPDVILAGRRVNNYIPKFIAEQTIKKLINLNVHINGAKIAVLGVTYKEDCPDLHDSRILDLINELKTYDVNILVHDPLANHDIAEKDLGIHLVQWNQLKNLDAVIIAVSHHDYKMTPSDKYKKILNANGLIMDIKGILNKEDFETTPITLWRL
jgi:UDP-N-acetyl-D-galactosamine dehydrogenase